LRDRLGRYALLPGDSLLFAVGALAASTGQLDVYLLIALLIGAALAGDNLICHRQIFGR